MTAQRQSSPRTRSRKRRRKWADVPPPRSLEDLARAIFLAADRPDPHRDHTAGGTAVYTDGSHAYDGLPNRAAVRHSVGEYVRDVVHTNGVESFWSMLKRAHKGTFHRMSPKHLQRYVDEFAGRHNIRDFDTIDQMGWVARSMAGKRLMYGDLIAPTGESPLAT